IGKFFDEYSCDGTSQGWKTGGAIKGLMTIKNADHVPVVALGCKSLCSLLIGDAKSVKKADGYLHCPTNADGTYPSNIGDSCLATPGGSCNDSITLTATFAAYGITIH
ncbi:MAG: hypothetical protein ACHREM_19145, partial [Polyangiales bacterium]